MTPADPDTIRAIRARPCSPSSHEPERTTMTDHLAEARACLSRVDQAATHFSATTWLTATCEQIIDHLEAQQTEASLRRGLADAQIASELIPVVAHKGPNDTDLSLLDEAAHKLEHGYSLDSNASAAVVRLIRNAIRIARQEQP